MAGEKLPRATTSGSPAVNHRTGQPLQNYVRTCTDPKAVIDLGQCIHSYEPPPPPEDLRTHPLAILMKTQLLPDLKLPQKNVATCTSGPTSSI